MSARLLEQCALCDSKNLRTVLSLGSSPPTCVMAPVGNRWPTEEHHPLELLVCEDCTLAQLSVIVDPAVVFPLDYPYSSGNSQALHANFEDLAREAAWRVGGLTQDDLVVDIGANDGTLLSKFTNAHTFGVEPTNQVRKIEGEAIKAFFSEDIARQIIGLWGQAKVITACNVLAHVPNINDVMRGIKALLADDGILVAENHDFASVVDGQWDAVYHEHLRFYDPYSFHQLLEKHGLRDVLWQFIPTHGGSFRMIVWNGSGPSDVAPERRNYNFQHLAGRAADARDAIRLAATGGGMFGIGATARATTIINYCGLDVEDLECVCEVKGSDKIGHYIPGTRIPVVDEALLFREQPERALLLSWHLADRIVPVLREHGYVGEIILPLPQLQTA